MQNFIKNTVLLALLVGTVQSANYLSERPSSLKQCALADPNFKICLANNFQSLFKEWKSGIPGQKAVGSIDPLILKRVKIVSNFGSVALQMDLRNVSMRGLSAIKVLDMSFDIQTLTASISLLIPRLDFNSDFRVKGDILGIHLNGHGTAVFDAEKLNVGALFKAQLKRHDGFNFIDLKHFKSEIKKVEGFHMRADNLFGGNKFLEDSANELFNANWRELYPALQPVIEQTIDSVFLNRFSKLFDYVPAEYFVADLAGVLSLIH